MVLIDWLFTLRPFLKVTIVPKMVPYMAANITSSLSRRLSSGASYVRLSVTTQTLELRDDIPLEA
jgi:hypothetical protein